MPDRNNRLQDCPLGVCPPVCQSVFDRVVVSHAIARRTRVMWELLDTFTEPGPLEFQLQVGQTANPDANDWENVGLPVVDQYLAYDDEQRVWGKTNWTHYRLKLTTAAGGTHYSLPTGGMGILDRRSWRLVRDMIRQRLVAYRYGPGGQAGYLLKRRVTGEPCSLCTDHMTKEVRNPSCPNCYGTGFKCGYFYPIECVWAELNPRGYRTELDGGQARGTVNDVIVKADMVGSQMLGEDDVWIAAKTDDRYFVHRIDHVSEVRGVPVAMAVELRLIPFSHVVYTIEIPQQLQALGLTE